MTITIKELVEERKEQLKPFEKEIDILNKDVQELLNDPKVKEYLEKKKELEKEIGQLETKTQEFYKNLEEKCTHPMLYVKNNHDGFSPYGIFSLADNNSVNCILCGAKISVYSSMKDLYQSKRLLGHEIIDHDYYEGRTYYSYEPVCTIEEAQNYYYKLYKEVEIIREYDSLDIIPEDFNIEEKVWEHFCKPQTKTKTKRRI